MRVLNDFACECGKVTEEYLESYICEITCSCGKTSVKKLSEGSYFKIDGFRMDINTEKWAKTREKNFSRENS